MTDKNYSQMTLAALKEEARAVGLVGYSRLTKDALAQALASRAAASSPNEGENVKQPINKAGSTAGINAPAGDQSAASAVETGARTAREGKKEEIPSRKKKEKAPQKTRTPRTKKTQDPADKGENTAVEEIQRRTDSQTDARSQKDKRYARLKDNIDEAVEMEGTLTVRPEGYGYMTSPQLPEEFDQVYVAASLIQRFKLITGDIISGKVRAPKESEAYPAMLFVEEVNGRLTRDIIEEEKQRMSKSEEKDMSLYDTLQSGILDIIPEGYGFLRMDNYMPGENDIYVSPSLIRRYKLHTGDKLTGKIRMGSENDKYDALLYIESINDMPPEQVMNRPTFERLVPIFPDERITLETPGEPLVARILDIFAPVGKGQRGLIVSPPKAGKTTILKAIAKAVEKNYPDIKLIVLLVDERPEEVTDMQRSVNADVVFSTFDQKPSNHVKAAEMVLERAKRLVESGTDVMVLVDSITRLARANNLVVVPSGRTLSGGLDPESLYFPKKFFGAARNIENGGSLTILATALVETGSRMDDMIYEEFKGTGNMEVILDRSLSEMRIFPAININRSGTRREDLLLTDAEQNAAISCRKTYAGLGPEQFTEAMIKWMSKTRTKNNDEFVRLIVKQGNTLENISDLRKILAK